MQSTVANGENPLESAFLRQTPTRTRRFYSMASARDYFGKIEPGLEILGLTKGQFSLSDLIHCIVEDLGPCEVDISTWTAAGADASRMISLVEAGQVKRMRWVVDNIFVKRQPGLSKAIIEAGGEMRILKTHAKFAVFRAAELNVVLRTSMNLNANPRIEYFEISESKEMASFFTNYIESVFKNAKGQRVTLTDIETEDDLIAGEDNPLALL